MTAQTVSCVVEEAPNFILVKLTESADLLFATELNMLDGPARELDLVNSIRLLIHTYLNEEALKDSPPFDADRDL